MMPPLSDSQQRRLVGVLGLLSSDQAGERAAAALLASRLVKSNGLTWAELIIKAGVAQSALPAGTDTRGRSDLRSNLALCRRHLGRLNDWEAEFVSSLAAQRKPPSPAQSRKLAQIADALRKDGKL